METKKIPVTKSKLSKIYADRSLQGLQVIYIIVCCNVVNTVLREWLKTQICHLKFLEEIGYRIYKNGKALRARNVYFIAVLDKK